jgi:hypothetical protein
MNTTPFFNKATAPSVGGYDGVAVADHDQGVILRETPSAMCKSVVEPLGKPLKTSSRPELSTIEQKLLRPTHAIVPPGSSHDASPLGSAMGYANMTEIDADRTAPNR